jgi:hypothetical protein
MPNINGSEARLRERPDPGLASTPRSKIGSFESCFRRATATNCIPGRLSSLGIFHRCRNITHCRRGTTYRPGPYDQPHRRPNVPIHGMAHVFSFIHRQNPLPGAPSRACFCCLHTTFGSHLDANLRAPHDCSLNSRRTNDEQPQPPSISLRNRRPHVARRLGRCGGRCSRLSGGMACRSRRMAHGQHGRAIR